MANQEPVGLVSLVGAGPGDPGLLTVRGLERLRAADVVVYDDLVNTELLAHAPPAARRVYVGKRGNDKTMPQHDIGELLAEHGRKGLRVVRLKGGDPFVFGRGGEEAQALAWAGVPFEVVPGVTAAVAAPAYAGIPLTHRDHADAFEVMSGHDPHPGRPLRPTAVVLMGMRRLAENVNLLKKQGYTDDEPAAVVRWGTTSRQRTVVATLGTIAREAAHLGSPAVLVVGGVVGLREEVSWFERRPLFGRRVLVTRARHQAGETCALLEALGAEVVCLPTIEIHPPDNPARLRRALGLIDRYHDIIFTSANGVEAVRRELWAHGRDARALGELRVVAIGPGTAAALGRMGIRPDLVPDDHRAEGILDKLPAGEVRGRSILIPRAAVAREILPDTLRERGAEVDVVPAYVTGIPDESAIAPGLARLRAGEVDVLTFTSASTAQNLHTIVGPELPDLCRDKVVAAIGPVTADACRAAGLEVSVMPGRYTINALVEALAGHLAGDTP